ncbi:MAG TPA: P-loop NTPase fold protein [Bacteroidia bacterium]|nr:P-loop NTPase fold protein [Bacteroidia bacterium]
MELIEIIKKYITQKDTDYAILINGAWGSGKTFFWRNTIAKAISEMEYGKSDEGSSIMYSPLYVSLNGLSKIDQLDKKIFVELNPFWKKKGVKVITNIAKIALNKIINLSEEQEDEFIKLMNVSKDKILCFDDLERLDTELLNEVFGYINLFTEHDNLKIIVIGDELKLKNALHNYKSIKEKLIRFTYEFKPIIRDIFSEFVKGYSQNYLEYLKTKKDFICELFEKGNHSNLRSLKFLLDLFESIYYTIKNDPVIENNYYDFILDRLLLFATTYTIEYKINEDDKVLESLSNLSSENIVNRIHIDFEKLIEQKYGKGKEIESEESPKFYEIFRKKYLPFYDVLYDYYDMVATYLHTGFLNKSALVALSSEIQKTVKSKEASHEASLISRLTNILVLKDEEFDPLIKEIKEEVLKGSFLLTVYPNIFIQLLHIESQGINGFKIDDSIFDIFEAGMRASLNKSTYYEQFQIMIPDIRGGNAKYDRIKHLAIELNESLHDNILKDKSENLLNLIKNEKCNDLLFFLASEADKFNPYFMQVDAKIFFDLLKHSSNNCLNHFHDGLKKRYNYQTISDTIRDESQFFQELKKLIDTYLLNKENKPISEVLLAKISMVIERLLMLK